MMGDVRTKTGLEHKNKVANILEGHYSRFQDLYSPLIETYLEKGILVRYEDKLQVKDSNEAC